MEDLDGCEGIEYVLSADNPDHEAIWGFVNTLQTMINEIPDATSKQVYTYLVKYGKESNKYVFENND